LYLLSDHFLLCDFGVNAEKANGPKSINDMKLINAGKILENSKTLAESRVPVGELPGCVITMHVVVRPSTSDKASGNPLPSLSLDPETIILLLGLSVAFCNLETSLFVAFFTLHLHCTICCNMDI
jgi:hypothetical protein